VARTSRLYNLGVSVLLCGAATCVHAQWIDYPTPGMPRTKNGAPNLDAPSPRTPAGKPDLTGIWYSANVVQDDAVAFLPRELLAAIESTAGSPPPGPSQNDNPCQSHSCIEQEGFPVDGLNIGRRLTGMTLPYQAWAREAVIQQLSKFAADDPHARCVPPSYPRAYSLPQHMKIVQTPGLVVMLHEFNASYRQIFVDGRPLPADPLPSWNGYSTGRWEKDTLVVETIGFRAGLWLDMIGSPLSDAAHITERFQRVSVGTLKVQVTVDDPKAYTKPWTVTLEQHLVPDTELLDDICVENERSNRLLLDGVSP